MWYFQIFIETVSERIIDSLNSYHNARQSRGFLSNVELKSIEKEPHKPEL